MNFAFAKSFFLEPIVLWPNNFPIRTCTFYIFDAGSKLIFISIIFTGDHLGPIHSYEEKYDSTIYEFDTGL